ncbi:hypothetical protein DFP72DRAFT_846924 [Ephemerocybe angulata]|uniref:Uncharacterized protein n=1 Tax=Ephemerocybe angulata TaxID=980116 RepID=A0A8H6HZK1_9AGAR|nr:hypothetical protein DFP72DRAFT_846924 [Tulosesus angulatus]
MFGKLRKLIQVFKRVSKRLRTQEKTTDFHFCDSGKECEVVSRSVGECSSRAPFGDMAFEEEDPQVPTRNSASRNASPEVNLSLHERTNAAEAGGSVEERGVSAVEIKEPLDLPNFLSDPDTTPIEEPQPPTHFLVFFNHDRSIRQVIESVYPTIAPGVESCPSVPKVKDEEAPKALVANEGGPEGAEVNHRPEKADETDIPGSASAVENLFFGEDDATVELPPVTTSFPSSPDSIGDSITSLSATTIAFVQPPTSTSFLLYSSYTPDPARTAKELEIWFSSRPSSSKRAGRPPLSAAHLRTMKETWEREREEEAANVWAKRTAPATTESIPGSEAFDGDDGCETVLRDIPPHMIPVPRTKLGLAPTPAGQEYPIPTSFAAPHIDWLPSQMVVPLDDGGTFWGIESRVRRRLSL